MLVNLDEEELSRATASDVDGDDVDVFALTVHDRLGKSLTVASVGSVDSEAEQLSFVPPGATSLLAGRSSPDKSRGLRSARSTTSDVSRRARTAPHAMRRSLGRGRSSAMCGPGSRVSLGGWADAYRLLAVEVPGLHSASEAWRTRMPEKLYRPFNSHSKAQTIPDRPLLFTGNNQIISKEAHVFDTHVSTSHYTPVYTHDYTHDHALGLSGCLYMCPYTCLSISVGMTMHRFSKTSRPSKRIARRPSRHAWPTLHYRGRGMPQRRHRYALCIGQGSAVG